MCVSTKKYPLVVDTFTGKKKVLFQIPIEFNNRDDVVDVRRLKLELKLALKGNSNYQSFNLLLEGKDYQIEDIISVPCGICEECLASRSRDWSTRIMLEASLYESNYFVTLTYDDEHLPHDHMLVKDEISRFNKKLKTYLSRRGLESGFRFYGVGEYGSETGRPHYHVIYFNLKIDDLEFYKVSDNGDLLFNSKFLSTVWSKGHVVIGEVTTGSACYVARYCDKKRLLTSQEKKDLKEKGIVPEFSVMSRMPGIGSQFYDDLKKKIDLGLNYVQLPRGQRNGIPLYYVKKFKANENEDWVQSFNEDRNKSSDIVLSSKLFKIEQAGINLDTFNNSLSKNIKSKKRLDL